MVKPSLSSKFARSSAAEAVAAVLAQPLPFGLDELPAGAALVGGAVRDAILGAVWGDPAPTSAGLAPPRNKLDLDFVVPSGAIALGRKLAARHRAGFVALDPGRDIGRVAFPNGCTVDLAAQVGDSLEEDLQRRDFCANAIAYRCAPQLPGDDPVPLDSPQRLVDPLGGCADLARRQLRMVSPANLSEDPLRLLRAYRLAAVLDLTIEPATQAAIAARAPALGQVAAERVLTELYGLLGAVTGDHWLAVAARDGVLASWLPRLGEEQLAAVARLPGAIAQVQALWPELPEHLARPIAPSRPLDGLALARLALALGPEAAAAGREFPRLKPARVDLRGVEAILGAVALALRSNIALLKGGSEPLTIREQFFLFQTARQVWPSTAIAAVALGVDPERLREPLARWGDRTDPVAWPVTLVPGDVLAARLGISPGPHLKELLQAVALARAEGKIATAHEAIAWAREYREGTLG